MKKAKIMLVSLLSLLPISSFAAGIGDGRIGLQAGYGVAGSTIGVVHYWNNVEAGITGSYRFDNATATSATGVTTEAPTKIGTVGAFLGGRSAIGQSDFIGWGADFSLGFGTIAGVTGYSAMTIGPYISLEHYLSSNFLVTAWIDPYAYTSVKTDASTVSVATNSLFSRGGIGVSLLF